MSGEGRAARGALVSRDAELGVLASAAAEAARGALRVLLVSGPPGVGKTALVRTFRSTASGVHFRWAGGDEDETAVAFGVVDQLGLMAGNRATSAQVDSFTVGAHIVESLSGPPGPGLQALVIDDAHWADSPSLSAVSFALRRLRIDPVLVVVIYRDELLDRAPDGLNRLVADNGAHIRLGPLDTDALIQLSATAHAPPLSRPAAERLRRHTGGNPLHALALMTELDRAALESSPEALLPAPRSLSSLIVARLGRCKEATRSLVSAASVLGYHASVASVSRLANLADPSAPLDEAVAEELVVVPPPGHQIFFVHPLVRAAVYLDLSPTTRSLLHAEAANLVEDELAVVRHRVAASVGADAELAHQAAALGERHEASGDWAGAAEAFGMASRVSGAEAERQHWALRRTECLLVHGGIAEAAADAKGARSFAPSPLRDFVLGMLSVYSGANDEAWQLLRSAWDRCNLPGDDALAARIANLLGHISVNAGLGEETVTWARRSLSLNRYAPPPDAVTLLCLGLGALGRAQDGLAELTPNELLPAGVATVDALVGRGVLELFTDELAGAQATLSRASSLLAGHGRLQLRLIALFYLADAEYRSGRWSQAVLHSQLAVSLARDADQVWTYALVHAVAAFPLAAQGRWEPATAHVAAALDAAAAIGDGASVTWAATAGARLAHARGDFVAVGEALRPLKDRDDMVGRDEPGIQPWRSLAVDALIGLGHYDEAHAALATMDEWSKKRLIPTEGVRVGRLRGLLLAAQGQPEQAENAFAEAYRSDPSRRCPLEAALLDSAHGRVLRRAGKRRAAAAALGAALDRLQALGATPYLHIAQREASACGLAPRPRGSPAGAGLTPQEAAVATLVISGMSNRAVAGELVVSQKTVEYHLGNIFTKLGITSRTALAAHFFGGDAPVRPIP